MWRDLRDNWRDRRYWRWWWTQFLSGEAKLFLALLLALAVALAGFLSAEAMSSGSESSLTVSQGVVAVQRTMVRRIVSVRTLPVPDGRTVYVPGAATTVTHVITVRAPGKDKVVTRSQVVTVLRQTTVSQPVTVTVEAAPVTATVTRDVPGPTVTLTTTSPSVTVIREVTAPVRTVTTPLALPVTVTVPGVPVSVTVKANP